MNHRVMHGFWLLVFILIGVINAGIPPTISSFSVSPIQLFAGNSATLSWSVSGATSLSIDHGVGVVTGLTSKKITPTVTTTYMLTATNNYGAKTATISIIVVNAATISSFTATPAGLSANGGSTTLRWSVANATYLSIDQGVGAVLGKTSQNVNLTATKTFRLTAGNSYGYVYKELTVTVGPPRIMSFGPIPRLLGKGYPGKLAWTVWNSTSQTIDNGIGSVNASGSYNVSPSKTTIYTMTATNGLCSVTRSDTMFVSPLTKVNNSVYYTEHSLYIIPPSSQVKWSGPNSWYSVYDTANIKSYVSTLKSLFNADYFFVAIVANNLLPNKVPDVTAYRYVADGIGQNKLCPKNVPSICRYNIGGGSTIEGSFGVLDHEIGHCWGVFVGTQPSCHWDSTSTANGQMAAAYFPNPSNISVSYRISGNPTSGFTWATIDNKIMNYYETFSDQDLYCQGLNPTFPPLYKLNNPVFNVNHTMSSASVTTWNQAWIEARNGVRNPTYKTTDKRLRMAVIYVARDSVEVKTVFPYVERGINFFENGEYIDTTNFPCTVPFLANTKWRASVNGLLADLDGNHTPTISVSPAYQSTATSSAKVTVTTADADGTKPTVSIVPANSRCSISGSTITLSGLTAGSWFFTVKAQDAGGKKSFAHFVVDAGTGLGKQAMNDVVNVAPSQTPSLCLDRVHLRITYTIDREGMTTLMLYTLGGRLIAAEVNRQLQPGTYSYWLPRNRMAAGVSIAVLRWSGGEMKLKINHL